MVIGLEAFQKSFAAEDSLRRFLVDRHGTVWRYPGQGLGESLGYPNADFDAWGYAIRNLGAVEVSQEEGETVVSMRSATAHPDAVRAAERFLATLGDSPVRLRYEIGTWIEETCEGLEDALGRMAGTLAHIGRESRRIAFTAKSRKLDMLSEYRLNQIETAEEKLSLLFKKWRISQGFFDSDTAAFMVRFGLLDRTAIVSESANDGSLVFEHWGTSFQAYESYDRSWSFVAPGRPITNQPDPEYGSWVDRTYRGVLNERRPRFEFVDAVIQAQQGEPYRSRYDRLVLPWQSAGGRRILTGTSYQAAKNAPLAA